MAGGVVTLEQAKSGRSTCRASGEPIAKGEWRVGFETWISGRVAMAWMVRAAPLVLTLPVPISGFSQGCCCPPAWRPGRISRHSAGLLHLLGSTWCGFLSTQSALLRLPLRTLAQKPLPFLESCCRVEYALSAGGSQGTCKSTGGCSRQSWPSGPGTCCFELAVER